MLTSAPQHTVRIPLVSLTANQVIAGLSGLLLAAGLAYFLEGHKLSAAMGGGVALAGIPVGVFALSFVNRSSVARVAAGVIGAFTARMLASTALGVIFYQAKSPHAPSFWLAFLFVSVVILAFEVQKMQGVLRAAGADSADHDPSHDPRSHG